MLYRKKLLLAWILVIILITQPCIALAINDVDGHWAEEEINQWINKGWITGYSDGSFKPNSQVTRAEFITLINRAFRRC